MKRLITGVCILAAGGVWAGDAVSDLNGKASVFGGSMDGESGLNFDGSVTFPLGNSFGVQADGYYSDVSDRDFYGAGGHLFWRDCDVALLGITGGYMRENDVLDAWSAGVEGEYYLDRLTTFGFAGAANIEYQIGPTPFIDTDKTGFLGTLGAGFYFTDDVYASAAGTYALGNGLGQGRLEWQIFFPWMSVTADFAYGEHDYYHAMGGIRFYFGEEKSLIRRHREDDPPNMLHGMMDTIGTYGAEFHEKGQGYVLGSDGRFYTFEESTPGLITLTPVSGSYGGEGAVITSGSLTIGSGSYGSILTVINGGAAASGGSGFVSGGNTVEISGGGGSLVSGGSLIITEGASVGTITPQ